MCIRLSTEAYKPGESAKQTSTVPDSEIRTRPTARVSLLDDIAPSLASTHAIHHFKPSTSDQSRQGRDSQSLNTVSVSLSFRYFLLFLSSCNLTTRQISAQLGCCLHFDVVSLRICYQVLLLSSRRKKHVTVLKFVSK